MLKLLTLVAFMACPIGVEPGGYGCLIGSPKIHERPTFKTTIGCQGIGHFRALMLIPNDESGADYVTYTKCTPGVFSEA
jgi:hypothetical protein